MDPQAAHQAVQAAHPFVVVGNMAWNFLLIGALGFMIRLWMKNMETKVSDYCAQNRDDHKDIFEKLTSHTERIAVVEDRTKDL